MTEDDEIYTLTERGEAELSGATSLSPLHLELLVRIDDALNRRQLRRSMDQVDDATFDRTFGDLRAARLIEPAHLDTFGMQLQGELDAFTQASGAPEADAGVRSLKRSGYFVRIAKKPRRQLPPRQPGEMPTAVVVEDDANLSRFVSSYLGFGGFQVRLATNRAEVLSEFRKYPIPDLVLLDVMLPDVDGFDILASVRRHPALKNVPVVMLTGKASRESVLKGLAGGADGYITKPFEPDALMSVVRTVMGDGEEGKRPKA